MTSTPKTGSRAQVMHGTRNETTGGLSKSDLKRNKSGQIVSKTKSVFAKKNESPLLKLWRLSVQSVYKKPKYAGKFIAIKKGTPFYKDVKADYKLRVEKAGLKTSKKPSKN